MLEVCGGGGGGGRLVRVSEHRMWGSLGEREGCEQTDREGCVCTREGWKRKKSSWLCAWGLTGRTGGGGGAGALLD